MSAKSEAAEDLQEMMAAWETIQQAAKQWFPAASEEELYQICKGAMNRQLEQNHTTSNL